MGRLLLEFSKVDAEDIISDQGNFTIAYEIELDAVDPNIWIDNSYREETPLEDLVPESDIDEKSDELFYGLRTEEFFASFGLSDDQVGDLFLKWIKSLPIEEAYVNIIQTANSLDLLGAEFDNEWVEKYTDEVYFMGFRNLIQGDKSAILAFAKIAMSTSNDNLKYFIERELGIEIPNINQIDLFGEDSKIEALANLIDIKLSKLDRNDRIYFFRNIFKDSFNEDNYRSSTIDYLDFLKQYIQESDDLNPHTADANEEEQEHKENINQFNNIIFENGITDALIEQIISEINYLADVPYYAYEMEDYELSTFKLPFETESQFETWVHSQYENFKELKEEELREYINNNLENYFDRDMYEDPAYDEGHTPEDIENMVASVFPNFYNKWGSIMKFETDQSIQDGFEMSPIAYISSLEKAFEFLEDFYSDYDNQNDFEFNENTGLHTNISIVNRSKDNWNYFKGFLFLNDNFATKGFESRLRGHWSGSIRDEIFRKINYTNIYYTKAEFRKIAMDVVEANFPAIEKEMNDVLKDMSSKNFGFSIKDNRIEFRYPGGDVSFDDLRAATLYYAYIVKLITDPNFKRKEYLKRGTAFALGIKDEIEKSDFEQSTININGKEISPGLIIAAAKKAINQNPNPEPLFMSENGGKIGLGGDNNSILWLLDPSRLDLSDYSDVEKSISKYVYHNNFATGVAFFSVNEIDINTKKLKVTKYYIESSNKIISLSNKNPYGVPYNINQYVIKSTEKDIPLYVFGAGILSGEIKTAPTEIYAKIKLFSDPDRVNEQLVRVFPWLESILKVRDILIKNNIDPEDFVLGEDEFKEALEGKFDKLIDAIQIINNNYHYY